MSPRAAKRPAAPAPPAGTGPDPVATRLDAHNSLIHRMRLAATSRAENTSLRNVAREVGMSPSGLKKFLDGAAPYTPTLRRLRQWYLQYGAVRLGEVEAADASSALSVLLHDLSPDTRRGLARSILEQLGSAYEASGKPVPAWLPEMLAAGPPAEIEAG